MAPHNTQAQIRKEAKLDAYKKALASWHTTETRSAIGAAMLIMRRRM